MAGLLLRAIRKSFGATQVLNDVSLEVGDREFLTLLGPSGCGKSTLLRVIAGLESADSGTVSIGGRPVDGVAPRDRDCAMVFQSYALYPYMTVFENIALPLRMRELTRLERLPGLAALGWRRGKHSAIASRVRDVAQILGLGTLLARKPAQLSGGQRQRVALGRAMVRRPKLFLMDEPLSNLDAKLRIQTRAEIAQLHRSLGVAFVYVTHDQAEAMTMSDRIAVMLDGRLLQIASPTELYEQPADLAVAEFIGSPKINVLPARLRDDGLVDVHGHTLPITAGACAGRQVKIAFRPENASVLPRRDVVAPKGGIAGQVVHRENLGSDVYIHMRSEDQTLVIRMHPKEAAAITHGEEVRVLPEPERVSLFDVAGRRIDVTGGAVADDRTQLARH